MVSKRSTYLDSIHVLFKLKASKDFIVSTAGIIASPKLPTDNIQIVETIEQLLSANTDTIK